VRVNDGAPQVGPWVRLDLVEDHAVDDLAKPRCISELVWVADSLALRPLPA